jgi:hypothetical protein
MDVSVVIKWSCPQGDGFTTMDLEFFAEEALDLILEGWHIDKVTAYVDSENDNRL